MFKCKCGTEGEENFYKSAKNTCKECIKARSRKNRLDNIEQVREYDRNRYNAKERAEQHRERVKNFTPEQKSRYNKQKNDWRLRNKIKSSAHNKVAKALLRGSIIRPVICESCTEDKPLHAHHDDYNKPLEVRWLCDTCHKAHHKEEKANRR